MKKNDKTRPKINRLFLGFIVLFLIGAIARLSYLCIADINVGYIKLTQFIKNRNTNAEVITPTRGTIYDHSGNVLAQDVNTYKLIAYLSEKRSVGSKTLQHVTDKKMTAEKLAPLLKVEVSQVEEILNKEDKYQVEFGSAGKNLTQIEMEAIKALNLPGIDFIKSTARYYPNGDYAPYTLGYTKLKPDDNGISWMVGEMGVEEYFNTELSGELGYIEYEKDKNGYKILNGREYILDAKNGSDIYLTLDNNIQLWTEETTKALTTASNSEWGLIMVVDAKTGAILAMSSSPSFDPNLRNMTSYVNPFVSYAYEPGSTMKTWTYMCAIEKGTYNGSDTYKSGSKEYVNVNDKTKTSVISDWNKTGWGTINYDDGFAYSSNIGIANLVETAVTKDELKECFSNYGFGVKTDFTLKRELTGALDFNYPIEVATAGYGQGITTTPMQQVQALTAIANGGEMLKPYVISKMIDTNTNETILENNRTVLKTIASEETINQIKVLLRSVISNDRIKATGTAYDIPGYDIIGKTGTAQIFDYSLGKYISGSKNVIYSFAGMFPMDNPEVIVYAAISRPDNNLLSTYLKDLFVNIGTYLNIKNSDAIEYTSYNIPSYVSKDVVSVENDLKSNNIKSVIIGDGDKVIKQFPLEKTTIYNSDKIFLLTNNYDKKMINLIGYSYKEVVGLLNMLGINYKIEGTGYVFEQSIPEGSIIGEDVLQITLKPKY